MLQKILIEKVWTWYAIHFTHQPNGKEQKAKKKNFCRKKKKKKNIYISSGVNAGVVTKFKFRYSVAKCLLI